MRKLYAALLGLAVAAGANATVVAPEGWEVTLYPSNDAPVTKIRNIKMTLAGIDNTNEGLYKPFSGVWGEDDNVTATVSGPQEVTCKLDWNETVEDYRKKGALKMTFTDDQDNAVSITEEGVYTFHIDSKAEGAYTYVFTRDAEGNITGTEKLYLPSFSFTYTVGENVGVETVEAQDATPVYYNLMGQSVQNPQGGVFIQVKGGKATKVVR